MKEEEIIEPKKVKIYQILTGLTEEEYYTYDSPIFTEDYEALKCTNVIIKKSIIRKVVNKQIVVHYSSEIIDEQSFLLEDGVVIKSLDSEKLEWINKTEAQTEALLKERELEVYRELVPKLLSMTEPGNQGQSKNLFL